MKRLKPSKPPCIVRSRIGGGTMKVRLLVLLLAASTVTFSQTTESKDHKPAEKISEASSAAQQCMPKPAAEAERLAKTFNGSWTVSGNTEASPMGPAEKATGTERCQNGPGSFSVLCDANMKFERMGPFKGHGVMYWDAENKN